MYRCMLLVVGKILDDGLAAQLVKGGVKCLCMGTFATKQQPVKTIIS